MNDESLDLIAEGEGDEDDSGLCFRSPDVVFTPSAG